MKKMNFAAKMAVLAVSATMIAGFGSTAIVCAQSLPAAYVNSVSAKVSEDDAKKAAFKAEGLNEKDIVIKKVALDYDDFGTLKYDVDFYANGTEYDYDIDAMTGEVISMERDRMDAEDYAEMEAIKSLAASTSATAANAANAAAAGEITKDKALEIALQNAGLTANDVTVTKVHQEFDDDTGKMKWDVEFRAGAKEYNYDIAVDTGSVLESDVDFDD